MSKPYCKITVTITNKENGEIVLQETGTVEHEEGTSGILKVVTMPFFIKMGLFGGRQDCELTVTFDPPVQYQNIESVSAP